MKRSDEQSCATMATMATMMMMNRTTGTDPDISGPA
jgi:hypothetical protein